MRVLLAGFIAVVLVVGCNHNHEPVGGSDMDQNKGTGRVAGEEDTGGTVRSYDRGGAPVQKPGGYDENESGGASTNAPATGTDTLSPAPPYPKNGVPLNI